MPKVSQLNTLYPHDCKVLNAVREEHKVKRPFFVDMENSFAYVARQNEGSTKLSPPDDVTSIQ